MDESATRLVDVLVNAAGWAFVIWFMVDPDGPGELWNRVRLELAELAKEHAAIAAQLVEIRELPELELIMPPSSGLGRWLT